MRLVKSYQSTYTSAFPWLISCKVMYIFPVVKDHLFWETTYGPLYKGSTVVNLGITLSDITRYWWQHDNDHGRVFELRETPKYLTLVGELCDAYNESLE